MNKPKITKNLIDVSLLWLQGDIGTVEAARRIKAKTKYTQNIMPKIAVALREAHRRGLIKL